VFFAVLFGLLAALLFALSAALQQRAAQHAATETNGDEAIDDTGEAAPAGEPARAGIARGGATVDVDVDVDEDEDEDEDEQTIVQRVSVLLPLVLLLRRLVRHPLWLIGWFTNLIGFLSQAVALHFGSVALVQPLLVTQLLFTLPIAAYRDHTRPSARDGLAALSVCAGVVVFLSVRGTAPLDADPDRLRVILAGLIGALVVSGLVVAASQRPPLAHSTLVAVAAGLCFAMSAVLIKLTTEDLVSRGVAETAVDWPGYALAVSTLVGLVLGQEAFASGALSAAVAAMTITNPAASYLLGLFAFHAALPSGPGVLAAVSAAGLLLFGGAAGLAHSPSVLRESAGSATQRLHTQEPAAGTP
jgi:drug/metabolite transporter (DMT)-like permease